jgi:light-regulated signal transduction histidine kinase (bacteriophytochrome)
MIDAYLAWRNRVHPSDRLGAETAVQMALNGEKDYEAEFRIILPDDSIRYLKAYGIVQRNQAGESQRLIGITFDITKPKLAEAKILETANQLANTNHELETFSYSVSHDLRAPLRHMNGFVNALQQQLQKHHDVLNDPKVAHYLQVIERSSQKMGSLIDGLLTLSRYGRRPLESKQISIRELVDEAIDMIRSDSNHNPRIEFAIADLPIKYGDRTLLQQVFHNLIGNAVKFSRNEPHPCIEIDTLPNGTIRIKDNGVGFQMEYADKLFGAFQRLHTQTEFEGTGIGLAIVQRVVQRHGGSVWAEGYPNQGATFFVKI